MTKLRLNPTLTWFFIINSTLFSLGRKVMTNLDSHTKKQRHYFANKGLSSQSYVFSSSHVWMWELDHNKGEPCRIDAFELWCWRRLLRVPWTARRPIQAILKEINPEYSLEALMLKLTLQYFGHLMQREDLDPGDWTTINVTSSPAVPAEAITNWLSLW